MGNMEKGVSLSSLAERTGMKNRTVTVSLSDKLVDVPEVNRLALQLAGYFEHFDSERIQVMGSVECAYLETLPTPQKMDMYQTLLTYPIPCIVYCGGKQPEEAFLQLAAEKDIPVFTVEKKTCDFMAQVIRWLNVKLAPCISIHGVLVDVYGIGVLIKGESGVGKSEAALELIKRGHRLVSDDVVEIRRVSDIRLVGSAPDITKHFIELRGIGIVDVKSIFGIQSVEDTHSIDLVITLEDWDKDKDYDRLGLEEKYTEILDQKIVCHTVPIRAGRNLAIIVESTAVNHRQKQMGYNAAQELYKRVQENLTKAKKERS